MAVKNKPTKKVAAKKVAPKIKAKAKSRKQDLNGASAISASVETITPELAGDLLAKNPHNRKLRDSRVRRYAEDMIAGRWKVNAETIKIDEDGNILDGQHRLAAIIFADMSIPMLVARNVPSTTFDTVDTGAPRIVADALFISKKSSSVQLGSALGYLWRYRNGGAFARIPGLRTPTIQELEQLLIKEPTLESHIQAGYALSRKLHISQGMMSVLRHILSQIDEEDAYYFFDYLLSGSNLRETDPIFRLRERFMDKRAHLNANDVGALTFKAWNAHRKNLSMRILVWKSMTEPMPRPE